MTLTRADNQSAAPKANRRKLTNTDLDRLLRTKPNRQLIVWDEKETGLHVLVSPGPKHRKQATVTLRVCYYMRDEPGVPKYLKIGRYPDETITRVETSDGKETEVTYPCSDLDAMRNYARDIRNAAAKGHNPRQDSESTRQQGSSFKAVVKRYLARPQQKTQRSLSEVERIFERYVLPEWGDRQVESIEKSDVADLLSKIAERKTKGPSGEIIGTFSVARATRVQLSSFFNWYIEDHASQRFRSPIVKSNSKRWAQPQGRDRVLADDEIRALWRATGKMGAYGAVVRSALLTAQRFHKVSTMLKADLMDQVKVPGRRVDGNWIKEFEVADVWDPTRNDDPSNKGVSLVPLSPLAREVIDSAPDVDGENSQGLVFTLKGEGPLRGWSKFKNQLDKAMLEEMMTEAKKEGRDPNRIQLKPWQHRDLRRTARTLMSRSEISNDIAELCLGHAKKSVEKTYDKHDYLDRKQVAFKRLSDHIQMIVYGPATDEGNIVQLHAERA
jgi:hypothetical protein